MSSDAVPRVNDTLLRNAYALHQAGNLAEAARLCSEILRVNPKNVDVLCMLGQVHAQRGERAEADRLADEAMKIAKSSRDFYNLGCLLQGLARHEDALKSYDGALAIRPDYFEALVHRGLSQLELQQYADAIVSFERALLIRPNEAGVWHNRGNAALWLQRFDEALKSYDKALSIKPDYANAWENRGRALSGLNRHEEALASYDRAATLRPAQAVLWRLRGSSLIALKRYQDAIESFDKALATEPGQFESLFQRANALLYLKRHAEALAAVDLALASEPDHVDALVSRGAALAGLGRHDEALRCYEGALSIKSDCIEALVNRGIELIVFKRYSEALSSLDLALGVDPASADAHFQRGHALTWLRRYHDAIAAFEQCLATKPDHVDALISRAVSLLGVGGLEEAALSCDRALAIKPDSLEALSNRGGMLILLKRFEDALADYQAILKIDPNYPYAPGNLLQCRLHCCDWRNLTREKEAVREGLEKRERVVSAFQYVATCRSAEQQLACSRLWVANECATGEPLWRGERYRHDRIRVAYVSEDFRTHAVSSLMAGVWEQHDKNRFEIFAVSFGVDDKSEMRARVEMGFEHFIDVRYKSDFEIATLLKENEIDIAVDLMGFSGYCRPGIFALRPAPVQVNYLGYPATMGADFIDYLLADSVLIPEEMRIHYHEKVVFLPDSYMPNDSKRRVAARPPTRAETGLPEGGFVFCCFNNAGKFGPETFGVWMRLLDKIENSVLWLSDPGPAAIKNLKREAVTHGIAAERLVFAPPLPAQEDHLARIALADLFVDTLPYNAHTTASDALWAGVPVLTSPGGTLAGRVAASLLFAIGLPEMVAKSLDAYESTAVNLARDPSALRAVKAKLAGNRQTHPLFDTVRFTRHLEAAYTEIWKRYQRGEPAEAFAVERDESNRRLRP
jgi:predicted O-linked N-acetylglucosamine transferase (SPINDLY family)